MIEQIVTGKTYRSRSGQLFRVTAIARHAQDCSIPMVVYQNIDPTVDAPAMTAWVVDESIFLRRFSEVGQ